MTIEELKTCFREKKAVIAVSGKSGCGNTTVSSLIARTLDITLINYTFRSLAKERGITLEDVMEEAARSHEIDRLVDTRQIELAEKKSAVLASRLAIWLKKDALLKVYLHADFQIRVERIGKREGWTIEQTIVHTEKRDREDHQRYQELYNIDNNEYQFADIILDTGSLGPEQLLGAVLDELRKLCR